MRRFGRASGDLGAGGASAVLSFAAHRAGSFVLPLAVDLRSPRQPLGRHNNRRADLATGQPKRHPDGLDPYPQTQPGNAVGTTFALSGVVSGLDWAGPGVYFAFRNGSPDCACGGGLDLDWCYGAERELRIGRFLLFAFPGALLVLGGVVLWFSDSLTWLDALRGGLLTLIVLSILLLAALPLWARFLRSYKGSLEEQTRQTVRADMAAHLHDSVLQTLALIRARAHDPVEVAKLARAEERHLRSWLYSDREASADSVVTLLKEVAAQVEDLHGVAFDVVSVGDARPGDWSEPLVAATREALTNAAKHAEPPFSLYIEVGEDKAECFVRDHGGGFDLDDVAADRHGVKQSIIERLARHGGRAQIKTRESGTEVQMEVPR